jgi:aryl-alcohol dehydrogenase (NADP+)
MEYTNLGSTGVKVSRICLGCMTYGTKKWRQWVLEEEESRPFIKQALEFGINFFDTADRLWPIARQAGYCDQGILSHGRRSQPERAFAQAHHARH